MKAYKLEELFKFALNMEEQGRAFYNTVSAFTDNREAKEIFAYLRDQEIEHAKTFAAFYNTYAKSKAAFSAPDQFEDVLDTLFRGLLLPDISEVRDTLQKKKKEGLLSITKISMEVELNTVYFYKKLKEMAGAGEASKALDRIITEEESHLVRLKNVRADLDPFYSGLDYAKFF